MIHTNLNNLFTDIANAIRMKNNSTDKIVADDFPTVIENTLGISSDDATAKSTEILSNATAYVKNTKVIGTMSNQGNIGTQYLTTNGQTYSITPGFYSGGKIVASFTPGATIKTGTVTSTSSGVSITGLGFTPTGFVIWPGVSPRLVVDNSEEDYFIGAHLINGNYVVGLAFISGSREAEIGYDGSNKYVTYSIGNGTITLTRNTASYGADMGMQSGHTFNYIAWS